MGSEGMAAGPADREPGEAVQTVPILRVRAGEKPSPVQDEIVVERELAIVVNGATTAVVWRLPGYERELAAGYCLTAGIVRDPAELTAVAYEPAALSGGSCGADAVRVVTSGCGPDRSRDGAGAPGGTDGVMELRVGPAVLPEVAARMAARQRVFARTGGTHAVCVARPDGSIEVLMEDVGRHNAFDKAIGWYALNGRTLSELRRRIVVVSGRVNGEIAAKAVAVGIPLVASVSAPTSAGYELCKRAGVTLVGFVRGAGMNLYTHPERIMA